VPKRAEREVSRGRTSGERAGRAARRKGPNGKKSATTVSLGRVRRQKSRQLELPLEGKGEARPLQRRGETPTAANRNERSGIDCLMARVVEGGNVTAALK